VGGQVVAGDPGTVVTGATVDSRRVRAGDLFFALPGRRADGHAFVAAALAAGARAAVVHREVEAPGGALIRVPDTVVALADLARWLRRQRPDLAVVGITGSLGKTTTKEMAAAVLGRRFRVLKSEGNYNTEIGLPLTLLGLEPGHEAAVLEMAMRGPGEIARLASIAEPQVGVVTVVAESHLEFLGSLERVAAAKGELVEALPPDGVAVLNADDPRVLAMRQRTSARVLTFGRGEADVRAHAVESLGPAGSRFLLQYGGREVPVRLAIPGPAAVTCALAAAATGVALGVPLEEIAAGLAGVRPAAMRNEVRRIGSWTVYIDCYNASPTSTVAALTTLREVAGRGRAVAILGDMFELGALAEEGHRRVGRHAARTADVLLAVGQWAPSVLEGWREAGGDAARAAAYPDKAALVADLNRWLQPGDAILVKGSRGMEMERVVEALAARA
ncbi:MAG: UDP-N-acetylmuramoylalanyl-D-glutamate--2,6-diaminopimelate ligase, partial [Bacillota bacterium]